MGLWKIEYHQGGIYLPELPLWLDPRQPKDRAFVSHAHFDHLAGHREMIVSEPTAHLIRARLPGERSEIVLPFGRPYPFNATTQLTLLPAGHIFGSAQLMVKQPGRSLVYSGDFKLRPGLSAEPCQTAPADVLIMETTFGLPQYVFPPTAEVMKSIIRFCEEGLEENEVPVLFGYSLGKSQELLCGLHQAGLPIMLHPGVAKVASVYESLGVSLPSFEKYEPGKVGGHVLICPPNANQSSLVKKIKSRRTAAVTGWALAPGARFRYQCDEVFPLSDHAGYDDLLAYVEAIQPREVYTLHGFANEFAQTLRKRGIEAWSLTADNQLEIPMPAPDAAKGSAGGSREIPEARTGPASATDFSGLCRILEACAHTTRKSAKVEALSSFIRDLAGHPSLPDAVTLMTGRPCLPHDGLKMETGSALIRRAAQQLSGTGHGDFRSTYFRHQDSGSAIQELLVGHTLPRPTTIQDLKTIFVQIAGKRGPASKLELLKNLLLRLEPREAKWLVKILTGDLRAGLKEGLVEEALARAFGLALDMVKEAHLLSGSLAEVARLAPEGRLQEIELVPFRPLRFMLASPEPDAESIIQRTNGTWMAEEKFDGIRCQLHKLGGRVELFSRDLHRITGQFPELGRAALHLREDAIMDGEILAWSGNRALPFSELQKRLGRKEADLFMQEEIPPVFLAFDCLWHNGQTLVRRPWSDRRKILESLLSPQQFPQGGVMIARTEPAPDAERIEELFQRARSAGNEGLMIKDPASIYTPGRRGISWLKLKKAAATLDVAVVAAEWGHGKRKDLLSDFTFAVQDGEGRLKTVGKAYSGLTDAELADLTEYFKAHTLEVLRGRTHRVEPAVILEVAFDSIQASIRHDSGFALRFPRIVRLRPDKTLSEIDTVEHCRRLAAAALPREAPTAA